MILSCIVFFSFPYPSWRKARVVEQPRVFKGPRFHTVEFQPWEGGPRTVVEIKVRAALLRPAHAGATSKNDHLSHGGEDPIPRPPAFSGEAAATTPVPSSPSFSRCSSVSQESFSITSLGMTRGGALTRKALREMERRSITMTSTSPKGRSSLVKEGGNGVDVQTEGIDSDDMDLDEGDDSEKDQDDYDGSEKDDQVQGGNEREESNAAVGTSIPAKSGGPGVDSKYPMFFPVGTRVILKKLGSNKGGPKGPHVDRDDLVGKEVRRR